jgi:hypothetical protein
MLYTRYLAFTEVIIPFLYIKSVIPCELSKRRCTIYLKLKGSYRVYQLCDIEL